MLHKASRYSRRRIGRDRNPLRRGAVVVVDPQRAVVALPPQLPVRRRCRWRVGDDGAASAAGQRPSDTVPDVARSTGRSEQLAYRRRVWKVECHRYDANSVTVIVARCEPPSRRLLELPFI